MESEQLRYYGIDYEKGLKNCINNEDFYKKILDMFLNDRCFSSALKAKEEKNYKELFSYMHELKGITGNAALFRLYDLSIPIVELLRNNEQLSEQKKEELDNLFIKASEAYALACEGIRAVLQENK